MRILLAAALITAVMASPALAQTRATAALPLSAETPDGVPPPPAFGPQPTVGAQPMVSTQPAVSPAQLDALTDRIAADEATMTRLRDVELAQQNERIRAIRPALSHEGGYLFVLGWLADL